MRAVVKTIARSARGAYLRADPCPPEARAKEPSCPTAPFDLCASLPRSSAPSTPSTPRLPNGATASPPLSTALCLCTWRGRAACGEPAATRLLPRPCCPRPYRGPPRCLDPAHRPRYRSPRASLWPAASAAFPMTAYSFWRRLARRHLSAPTGQSRSGPFRFGLHVVRAGCEAMYSR